MMRCLCCGKEIIKATEEEMTSGWHKKCIIKFFGTTTLPEIDVNKQQLENLIKKTVTKGLVVPGVQKKMSLHLSKEDNIPRLTVVNYPTGYICKPQSTEYPALPEAEFLVMKLAETMGIRTVPNALIRMSGQKNKPFAYITRRVDRVITGEKPQMFAMEDFCQLSQRLTEDKYKGSYERVGKLVEQYSSKPALDLAELFTRLVFCFLTGNSDMHLKNFSLIEDAPGSRHFVLSPAYDLLPVNVIVPADQEEMALTLNGKKQNLTRNDFLKYAENIGVSAKAASKMIDKQLDHEEEALQAVAESYLPKSMKESMSKLITSRFKRLKRNIP